MSAIVWPDLVIAAVALLGALKGFKRGFVNELAGALALAFAIAAVFVYRGNWDAWVGARTHLAPAGAHFAGTALYALAAYAIVLALGAALAPVARLPLIGPANALLGALMGLVKAAVFVWAILYVALFFPLPRDIRGDLHRSSLIAVLQSPNERLDGTLRASLPPFVQPYVGAMFARHRV